MKLFKLLISIITSVLLFANVSLAEKWDMALAYGAGNFHSANATEFAKNVTEKSGGKLTIVSLPPLFSVTFLANSVAFAEWKLPAP